MRPGWSSSRRSAYRALMYCESTSTPTLGCSARIRSAATRPSSECPEARDQDRDHSDQRLTDGDPVERASDAAVADDEQRIAGAVGEGRRIGERVVGEDSPTATTKAGVHTAATGARAQRSARGGRRCADRRDADRLGRDGGRAHDAGADATRPSRANDTSRTRASAPTVARGSKAPTSRGRRR